MIADSPAPSPSGSRLLVAFAILPPAQALLALVIFPIYWRVTGILGPVNVADHTPRMALITGLVGVFVTVLTVPVVLELLRRGQATLRHLLVAGAALGNLPFALYLGGLILPATLGHLVAGTLGNHLVPLPDLLMAGLQVAALGATFGVLSAGLFWIVAFPRHARR